MKFCCLFLAVAFTAALTTSVDCVPHARHARAVAPVVVKPKAAAPKAAAPKAAAPKAAAPKAAGPSVAKILPELVKSLSGTRYPTTKNWELNKLADIIVTVNILQTDSKGKLTQKAVSNLANETVNALVAASNTSKANGKKMLNLVKKGIKRCTNIDCVMKQVGVGAKFLSSSAPKVLQELFTAATEMAASPPYDGVSTGSSSGRGSGRGNGSGLSLPISYSFGAGAMQGSTTPRAFQAFASNGSLNFSSTIGNAGPNSVNHTSTTFGFGAGAVQGSTTPRAFQAFASNGSLNFSSTIGNAGPNSVNHTSTTFGFGAGVVEDSTTPRRIHAFAYYN